MAKLLLLAILGFAALYAYEHYFGEKTPPPRLAPEGIVYALERASVQGPDGVVGIPPTAELKLIAKEGDSSVVEYRGRRVSLPNALLTRDLGVIEAIRRDEEAARRKVAAQTDTQPPAPPKAKTSPKLEKLNEQLVGLHDRIADIQYQIKRLDLALNEQKPAGTETAATIDLKSRRTALQNELNRLQVDEGYLRDLVRREARELEKTP
jgi:hypothetical protein